MKQVVERERNKIYYRVLHLPLWIWVFFILPGSLAHDLYLNGPDRRHWFWLAAVSLVCFWRGIAGRLPGVERRPYITHYGVDQPNVPYRMVCYTAAWIDLLVPFTLNLIGLLTAVITGKWILRQLYAWWYYPMALAVVLGTWLDWTPRARRSIRNEGVEKGWFYVGLWTVVPAQLTSWALWRLSGKIGLGVPDVARVRLAGFLVVSGTFFLLTLMGKLPRTQRYYTHGALSSANGQPHA